MCDSLVAVPPGSADGAVWFGKNSDREPGELQVVETHPARDHGAGSSVVCTHLEIPQSSRTHRVVLSRPAWMWGAEMGANEHGLAMGNEAVFTRLPVPRTGLTGMDLLRLALERCYTAREAVDLIIELAARHGQGGRCGYRDRRFRYFSSFAIADPEEAWILETAGPFWAAERVRGVRTISNALSIGDAFHRIAPDAYAYARRKGWCRGTGDFHFARSFGDPRYRTLSGAGPRSACTLDLLGGPGGRPGRDQIMAALRGHGGMAPHDGWTMRSPCAHADWRPTRHSGQTTASMVSRLDPAGSSHWLTGTSSPCLSVFKPVPLLGDPVHSGPEPSSRYDGHSLFWLHERLHRHILRAYGQLEPLIATERDALQGRAMDPHHAQGAGAQEVWDEHLAALPAWLERVEDAGITPTAPILSRAYWRRQNRKDGIPSGARVLR
jgi:secernin